MESFLFARIGEKKIAINIQQIHFVIRNNGIVKIPEMPDWMEGVVTFRDRVITVVNNQKKLGVKNDKTEKKRIVLCEVKSGVFIGLNIDEYIGIKKVDEKDLNKLTIKLNNEIIAIIDLKSLLTEEEIELAEKI